MSTDPQIQPAVTSASPLPPADEGDYEGLPPIPRDMQPDVVLRGEGRVSENSAAGSETAVDASLAGGAEETIDETAFDPGVVNAADVNLATNVNQTDVVNNPAVVNMVDGISGEQPPAAISEGDRSTEIAPAETMEPEQPAYLTSPVLRAQYIEKALGIIADEDPEMRVFGIGMLGVYVERGEEAIEDLMKMALPQMVTAYNSGDTPSLLGGFFIPLMGKGMGEQFDASILDRVLQDLSHEEEFQRVCALEFFDLLTDIDQHQIVLDRALPGIAELWKEKSPFVHDKAEKVLERLMTKSEDALETVRAHMLDAALDYARSGSTFHSERGLELLKKFGLATADELWKSDDQGTSSVGERLLKRSLAGDGSGQMILHVLGLATPLMAGEKPVERTKAWNLLEFLEKKGIYQAMFGAPPSTIQLFLRSKKPDKTGVYDLVAFGGKWQELTRVNDIFASWDKAATITERKIWPPSRWVRHTVPDADTRALVLASRQLFRRGFGEGALRAIEALRIADQTGLSYRVRAPRPKQKTIPAQKPAAPEAA